MNKEIQSYVKKNHKNMTVAEMAAAMSQTPTTIRKALQSQGLMPKRLLNTARTTDVITAAVAEPKPLSKVMKETKMSAQSIRLRLRRLGMDVPAEWQPREHGKSLLKRVEARLGRMVSAKERLLFIDGNKRSKDIDNVVVVADKKVLLSASKSLKAAAYDAVKAGKIVYNAKTNTYEFRK